VGDATSGLWVIDISTFMPPAPELAISQTANGVVLVNWRNPSSGPTYLLQQCTDLSAGDWSQVTTVSPGRYEVTDPGTAMFFRLINP
jgi:hypothetical protein